MSLNRGISLYCQGLGFRDAGEISGVGRERIRREMKKRDIPIRSLSASVAYIRLHEVQQNLLGLLSPVKIELEPKHKLFADNPAFRPKEQVIYQNESTEFHQRVVCVLFPFAPKVFGLEEPVYLCEVEEGSFVYAKESQLGKAVSA